jgi:hypothetical protein
MVFKEDQTRSNSTDIMVQKQSCRMLKILPGISALILSHNLRTAQANCMKLHNWMTLQSALAVQMCKNDGAK